MATTSAPPRDSSISEATALAATLGENLSRALVGKRDVVRRALVAVLSGGHLLIEDVPGVGKTLLAKALARSLGGTFRRVQGTPDLLPSDLTGVAIYDRSRSEWRFNPGPLFANVVLVDEINRATPRTQSALLEAMEERQVSVDGTTYRLPEPFVVVATQNPYEQLGTFALVEGQRDRFALVSQMGLPGRPAERALLLGQGGVGALESLAPVTNPEELARAIATVRETHCTPALADYVLDLADATRGDAAITLGASPRAALSLLRAAQAHAVIEGRTYVLPDDVKAVAAPALAHRLILAEGENLTAASAHVDRLLRGVPVPTG